MPRKSVKKIMKELMAKKKLTAKEKKLLAKMKKGGGFFDFLNFFGTTKSAEPVDQPTLAKMHEELKEQICKVCKAAFGEDGCKCGNTAPLPAEESSNVKEPLVTDTQTGNNEVVEPMREESANSSLESMDETQPQPQPQPQTGKQNGGRRKLSKKKNKRSKRASKKMKW